MFDAASSRRPWGSHSSAWSRSTTPTPSFWTRFHRVQNLGIYLSVGLPAAPTPLPLNPHDLQNKRLKAYDQVNTWVSCKALHPLQLDATLGCRRGGCVDEDV